MPEGTLKALSAHSELDTIMAADGSDCEKVLDKFAAEGIDVDTLAAQLQEDGAKSFSQVVERVDGSDHIQRRRSWPGRAKLNYPKRHGCIARRVG